ncbi:MAG: acetyl-coenzyme A synthetase, partial [Planctomycetia bacterium]|nr:acetyl-coenzyme A synthetase [Planctomycetia bacterium]
MSDAIENLYSEERRFPPPEKFALGANAPVGIHERAAAAPLEFWSEEAKKLHWRTPWKKLLNDSDAPFYKWFEGGRLNVTESCLDRHVVSTPNRIAFHWEGEPGDTSSLTYK